MLAGHMPLLGDWLACQKVTAAILDGLSLVDHRKFSKSETESSNGNSHDWYIT